MSFFNLRADYTFFFKQHNCSLSFYISELYDHTGEDSLIGQLVAETMRFTQIRQQSYYVGHGQSQKDIWGGANFGTLGLKSQDFNNLIGLKRFEYTSKLSKRGMLYPSHMAKTLGLGA